MKVKFASFWKNVSIVLLGTLAYQTLPLLVLPFFTRILPPEDIGLYFTWLGVVVVGAVVLTMRLDMAVLQANTSDAAMRIVRASVVTNLGFGVLAGIFIGLFLAAESFFQLSLLSVDAYVYVVLGVIAAIASAINLLVNSVLVRSARFREQALYKLYLGVGLSSSQLIFVYFFESSVGLCLAYSLSCALVLIFLMRKVGFIGLSLKLFDPLKDAISVVREQRAFVILSMPAALINMLSHYSPLFLLNWKIGAAASGQYGLTHKTLSAPLGLVGGAILSVFREESSRCYRESGNCEASYLYTARSLVLIAIAPFLVVFFWGRELFEFVFGAAWSEAGTIAELMAPVFLIRFVASPLSYMFFLANRQGWDLLWQVVLFLFSVSIFWFSASLQSAVFWYSIGSFLLYGVNLVASYFIAKGMAAQGG